MIENGILYPDSIFRSSKRISSHTLNGALGRDLRLEEDSGKGIVRVEVQRSDHAESAK
jgi:hypothetical protein